MGMDVDRQTGPLGCARTFCGNLGKAWSAPVPSSFSQPIPEYPSVDRLEKRFNSTIPQLAIDAASPRADLRARLMSGMRSSDRAIVNYLPDHWTKQRLISTRRRMSVSANRWPPPR
jgi:hypothetical protein